MSNSPAANTANTTATDPTQDQNLNLRQALNDAFAFIEGQKSVQTWSAVTFEELMSAQNDRLVGPDTPSRPNVYNRISKIGTSVVATVAQIKSMPDDAFANPDPNQDVNSPA